MANRDNHDSKNPRHKQESKTRSSSYSDPPVAVHGSTPSVQRTTKGTDDKAGKTTTGKAAASEKYSKDVRNKEHEGDYRRSKNRPEENSSWREKKNQYLEMPLEEKRKLYNRHVTRDTFPTEGVKYWQGDITKLEVDAIVNAANSSLLGGGGVDGAIHRAAGRDLYNECKTLRGCQTGEAKITGGYKLPAKYIIHTVGPQVYGRGRPSKDNENDLANCYWNTLELVKQHKLKSVAIPCISTGIYGYPGQNAAKTATETVSKWLKENDEWKGLVVFCVFEYDALRIYQELLDNVKQNPKGNLSSATDHQLPQEHQARQPEKTNNADPTNLDIPKTTEVESADQPHEQSQPDRSSGAEDNSMPLAEATSQTPATKPALESESKSIEKNDVSDKTSSDSAAGPRVVEYEVTEAQDQKRIRVEPTMSQPEPMSSENRQPSPGPEDEQHMIDNSALTEEEKAPDHQDDSSNLQPEIDVVQDESRQPTHSSCEQSDGVQNEAVANVNVADSQAQHHSEDHEEMDTT